jgi:hypothetical protein
MIFLWGVSLGGRVPSWGLSRSGAGLRFGAFDDEGFAVRGNSRRLLYKGRKRSHRFTILDGNSFEYDVILKREPQSNVMELYMDGAENYEFYRQPDFVRNDFLKGSCVVYRKDRAMGQGTGKLCHIHRPKIIDAGGRWAWGELLVAGNRLLITIPETWLADARYPVIVDPVVGCSQIGSQTEWDPWEEGKEVCGFIHEKCFIIDRFIVPQQTPANGLVAHYYSRHIPDRGKLGGYPIMYGDNDCYPGQRCGENDWLSFENGRDGWVDAGFHCESIAANACVWFGLQTHDRWAANFDYGFSDFAIGDGLGECPPLTFPDCGYTVYGIVASMYFHWGTENQHYVRSVAQGVTLGDSGKRSIGCCKKIATSLGASTNAARSVGRRIKIVTASFVRDYLTPRFLVARVNIALKSRITKDVVLRSSIK